MIKCPNCGRTTTGISCQWCNCPIIRDRTTILRKAKLAAREEAKRKSDEARQAKETRQKTAEEAKLAAREEAKRKSDEARQAKETRQKTAEEAKQIKKSLKQIEETCKQLRNGKIGTKEALRKLTDISYNRL